MMDDTQTTARPVAITVICILGFIGAALAIPLPSSGAISSLNPAITPSANRIKPANADSAAPRASRATRIIPAYTAVMAAQGMLTAATVGLRAMAAAKRSLRSRLVTGVLAVAGGTIGAATSGAVGAATGLALGLWIGGIQWWHQLGLAVTEEEERRAAGGAPVTPAPDPATAGP